MSQIRVVAWALITMEDAVLVQCDEEESFYRLPGGTVEVGETASEACSRELREEYSLEVSVKELVAVYENVDFDEVALIHRCDLPDDNLVQELLHREAPGVRLILKTLRQLQDLPTAPPRLPDLLAASPNGTQHLVSRHGELHD